MRKNLTKEEILRKRKDIRLVYAEGKNCKVPGIKCKFIKNDFAFSRVLITFVRNYGNSVARNRDKRIVKEIYRQIKWDVLPGFDLVFILLTGNFSFIDRQAQILSILKKAGLLQTENQTRIS